MRKKQLALKRAEPVTTTRSHRHVPYTASAVSGSDDSGRTLKRDTTSKSAGNHREIHSAASRCIVDAFASRHRARLLARNGSDVSIGQICPPPLHTRHPS